jgi:hypothetical protein
MSHHVCNSCSKSVLSFFYESPCLIFFQQDILELRDRKWVARQSHGLAALSTIAQVHEAVSCH